MCAIWCISNYYYTLHTYTLCFVSFQNKNIHKYVFTSSCSRRMRRTTAMLTAFPMLGSLNRPATWKKGKCGYTFYTVTWFLLLMTLGTSKIILLIGLIWCIDNIYIYNIICFILKVFLYGAINQGRQLPGVIWDRRYGIHQICMNEFKNEKKNSWIL